MITVKSSSRPTHARTLFAIALPYLLGLNAFVLAATPMEPASPFKTVRLRTTTTRATIILAAPSAPAAPGLTAKIDARNLTDVRYASDLSTITDARTASTQVLYPGNGRAVFGGLRYAF